MFKLLSLLMFCVKIAHITMPQTIFYIAHPNVFITENLNKESRDAKAQQLRYVT